MGSSDTLCSTSTICACGLPAGALWYRVFRARRACLHVKLIPPHPFLSVFASAEEDEIKDLSVQARIRQLHWMTPEHLEANIKLDVPEVASAIETAQEELITMDAKRAPQDKLACVVACSKSIFDILSKSAGEGVSVTSACLQGHLQRQLAPSARKDQRSFLLSLSFSRGTQNAMAASADDFLPALIYVLIKANPPMLHSNMEVSRRNIHLTSFSPSPLQPVSPAFLIPAPPVYQPLL